MKHKMKLKLILMVTLFTSLSTVSFAEETVTFKGSAYLGSVFAGVQEVIITGEVIAITDGLNKKTADQFGLNGFLAVINEEAIITAYNCPSGIFKVVASVGNFFPDPNGYEYYRTPFITEFVCDDALIS